ncbi:hypothetical protein L3X38_023460 [Prunus dulcis]|uniref:RecA family profile 1 domain-containing protein n=1 Tax=Prunus dulcis TaxID=3755 RepID=A0AAD4VXV0_PRUDU|nr:hypothetical protein L3X38_023460 [Prunus dulcis]
MTPQNLMLLPLSTPKLSIGCLILDDCLGGGIPCNSITELVGESGSGKTQLCLQLTATFIMHHTPNLIRLEPLEDIYVHGVHDAQQLIHVLGDIEAFIAIDHTRLPVKLIVIDSIAALFRSQYQTTAADLKRRSEMFFNISGTLKGLANKFGLAVVVTNQVVDFIGPHDKMNGVRLGNLESLDTSGRRVSPALGLAWAHCINSRVFLARHEQSIEVNIRNAPSTSICSQTHRTFHLVFAPHLAYASAEFVIKKKGIVGVSQ